MQIKNNAEAQGNRIEALFKKLGVSMNMKKTQFVTTMNYQRRKPGHIPRNPDRRFNTPIDVNMNGKVVSEHSFLKTLGVCFDNEITFKKH